MERKKEFDKLKKEYLETEMEDGQFCAYKKAIRTGGGKRKAAGMKISMGIAAAVFAAFLILPNISPGIAYAMEKMPVLGDAVSVVIFRDYQYDPKSHTVDVTVYQTKLIQEFKENVKDEEGYQDMVVKSEILPATEEYSSVKLTCYQGAGSGAQWDYFYTMNLRTGEQMALSDFFKEGADYKKAVSENIKKQMRERMAADENNMYWVDDTDMPDLNFKTITEETNFYINGKGEIVIAFNEGDVAPVYMGCVEFVIENEAVADILK